VSFEGELAEKPIWVGSESKGGGGGAAGYPPYLAQVVNVNADNMSGGTTDVTLLDGTVKAAFDGWVEVIVSGGYAGMSVQGPVNARQGIVCNTYIDPTGQPWISFGRMQNVPAHQWDLIGDVQLNIPVTKDDTPLVLWRGNWAPSSYVCSFRSYASVKWYSSSMLGDGTQVPIGGPGGGVPAGGSPGQVLSKLTASDYDTTWVTVAGAIASYRHVQTVSSAVWTIAHNLGFYPNVSVVDSSGREVIGEINYVSMNTVQITFSAAFGGEAYLS
jgi:hypothetical protein